jgi:hypothetical protein
MKALRHIAFRSILIGTIVCPGLLGGEGQRSNGPRLQGKAEDLWGNRLDLSQFAKGITLIHPFSPANCGYCLVDGEFVKENYFHNNAQAGGTNYLQCLFNPQVDIYAYQKHYRETSTPVLTFPADLHQYHRDGFPFLIAFRDGRLLYRGVLSPYEETFRRLQPQLWPTEGVRLLPTSPLHMVTRLTDENESKLTVEVYADNDEAGARRMEQRLEDIKKCWGHVSAIVKHESELTEDDYQMNLYVTGIAEQLRLGFLKSGGAPIDIGAESIQIGSHRFPKSQVGLMACFPNPHNPQRCIVLNLRGSKVKTRAGENWVDYILYRDGADGRPEILLHGLFDNDNGKWRFSPARAFGTAVGEKVPRQNDARLSLSEPSRTGKGKKERPIHVSSWIATPAGRMKTLGTASCRFPALAVDTDGVCWTAWEEDGDILLAAVNHPEDAVALAVESDASDSFHPLLASDGSRLWIFYLNDRDGFYRLYARHLDGRQLSEEILITEREPFDVITPSVAGNGQGRLAIAWTEWKANFRFLRFREMENRRLNSIRDVAIKQAGGSGAGYVNAWCPALVVDERGQPWGAWNQHYPAIVGVCAGNLVQEAGSVTRLSESMERSENGGYPSVTLDNSGRKWVFWESFGWDYYLSGTPQRILGSWYDEAKGQWSPPCPVSSDGQTTWNQTPRAAVDGEGTIWTVWSGRQNDLDKPWGIRVARLAKDRWSVPKLLSEAAVNARAPALAVGKDGTIWLTWHAGTGTQMQIQVLEYHPRAQDFEDAPPVKVEDRSAPRDEQSRQDDLGADNEKYARLSQREVAQRFFQACAQENWDEVRKFRSVSQRFKDAYGGLKIISIGAPFQQLDTYHGWYVPYEITLKSGEARKHNLALCPGPYGRFVVDGGL